MNRCSDCDYDLNDRTRNNGARLIVKHFNTSVTQHFYPIKITTTWNALPNQVVTSRTVNSFKNSLDKRWAENPPNVRVNWQQSSMPCIIQVCTVIGQHSAGNGPNGLSYDNYYYYTTTNMEFLLSRNTWGT